MTCYADPREAGFSLIEVLVAVLVLSTAGMSILGLMQGSTRLTASLEARSLASLAAENVLNTRLLNAGILADAQGEYSLAGHTYDWQLDVDGTSDAGLDRVVLILSSQDTETPLARIETFRRRRQP